MSGANELRRGFKSTTPFQSGEGSISSFFPSVLPSFSAFSPSFLPFIIIYSSDRSRDSHERRGQHFLEGSGLGSADRSNTQEPFRIPLVNRHHLSCFLEALHRITAGLMSWLLFPGTRSHSVAQIGLELTV